MSPDVAPIYLDHAATTPVDPRVARRIADVLALPLGNAAAVHAPGLAAHQLVEVSRAQVASLIGAAPEDILFTSGATESNNLAITGTARLAAQRGARPHLVTLATEHKSVLEPVRALQAQGMTASILRPESSGLLDPQALAAALRPETVLVSLLHVNNETGVAQDIPALAAICAARGVALHVDCCQSAGKLPLSLQDVALLSFTAHKLGGPQGVGALYVSPAHRGRLAPQMLGGGHERGLRAGTLAVHQIAGFGLAAELACVQREAESRRLAGLRDQLWEGLSQLPGALLNGHATARAPHILNVSFQDIEGESLFAALPELVLSTGSACNSRSAEPSFVLRALGRDTELAQGSLRFSLGRTTTEADIKTAIAAVQRAHASLRAHCPAQPLPLGGWVTDPPAQLWVGEGGARRLGAWVRFVVLERDSLVQEARVQVYGCPHTVAASRHVARQLTGQRLGGEVSATGLQPGLPEQWLQAVNGPVEKLGRMLHIEDAIRTLQRSPWPSR
jgi:cysteine desulfurase